MTVVTTLDEYADPRGNEIVAGSSTAATVRIKFTGSNNRVVVADGARLDTLRVDFDCDNGVLEIGSSRGVPAFSGAIRIGQDSRVRLGRNVSCTTLVTMSATEGTTITIGDDVMFASENQIRADDGHAIFDVRDGTRVNVSRSITIGAHVWLGRSATVLAGGRIGAGSVIGYGSVVTRPIPNNCIAAGVPARVLRRHIAWERPHLSLTKPYYKPDAGSVTRSQYWALTRDPDADSWQTRARRRVRRSRVGPSLVLVRAVLRRLR